MEIEMGYILGLDGAYDGGDGRMNDQITTGCSLSTVGAGFDLKSNITC